MASEVRSTSAAGRAHCGRRGFGRALVALAFPLFAACGVAGRGEPVAARAEPFRGPIVLVTLAGLRADAAGGASSATPVLDRFVAEASWAGTGVASSSWCGGSVASVLTGLTPAVHGVAHPARPWLRPGVRTLAEELAAAGFATRGFYSTPWLGPGFGLERGFEALRPLRRRSAERWLAQLDGGPSLTWIQLPLPGFSLPSSTAAGGGEAPETPAPAAEIAPAPARRRRARDTNAAPRQNAAAVRHEPDAVRQTDAAARQKPAGSRRARRSAPAAGEAAATGQTGAEGATGQTAAEGAAGTAREAGTPSEAAARPQPTAVEVAYRERVREADRLLGRLLQALRRGARYQEALVIVLADHGSPTVGRGFGGEATAAGEPLPPGLDLGRASVEVPLAILLPPSLAGLLQAPAGGAVGLDRVPATVLELAGLRPLPALAPSLLRPSAWATLSELWFANGYHEIALHEDGHQLHWRCRFAPLAADFEPARREALEPGGAARYAALIDRLASDFRARPRCVEGEEVVLEAWPATGGTIPVEDAARRDRMLDRLRRLRSFPPAWSLEPAPPPPALGRRELRALTGWGLPVSWQGPAQEKAE